MENNDNIFCKDKTSADTDYSYFLTYFSKCKYKI